MKSMGNRDEKTSSWEDIVRIAELDRPYRHKVVDGPFPVYSIFYTTKREGRITRSVINVPGYRDHILSKLAEIDIEIKAQKIYARIPSREEASEEIKKIRSDFNPTMKYHCLILDRADAIPVIRRAEYPSSVRRDMLRLEGDRITDEYGNKDETRLRYGLLFMLWFEITKVKKDPSKGEKYTNIEYKTAVLEEACPFKGQIPSHYLGASIDIDPEKDQVMITPKAGVEQILNPIEAGYFTAEQWSAVKNYEHGIGELVEPMSYGEALEKLMKEPILLDAMDDKGNFIYPAYQEILAEVKKRGLDFSFLITGDPMTSLPSGGIPEQQPQPTPAVAESATPMPEPAAAVMPEPATPMPQTAPVTPPEATPAPQPTIPGATSGESAEEKAKKYLEGTFDKKVEQ